VINSRSATSASNRLKEISISSSSSAPRRISGCALKSARDIRLELPRLVEH
jgi:hypothetical protein